MFLLGSFTKGTMVTTSLEFIAAVGSGWFHCVRQVSKWISVLWSKRFKMMQVCWAIGGKRILALRKNTLLMRWLKGVFVVQISRKVMCVWILITVDGRHVASVEGATLSQFQPWNSSTYPKASRRLPVAREFFPVLGWQFFGGCDVCLDSNAHSKKNQHMW